MHFLSKALTYLHFSLRFVIFLGLLGVAGYSLFSLSPVSYEDYQAYQARLNSENSQRDQQGAQVAGLTSGDVPSSFQNLLQKSGLNYDFTTEPGKAIVGIRSTSALPNQSAVEISNSDTARKIYEIRLSYGDIPVAELHGIGLVLFSSESFANGGKKIYRLAIEPAQAVKIYLEAGRPVGVGQITIQVNETNAKLLQLP